MNRLSKIPIRVERPVSTPSTGTIGGGVSAILIEIASLLERLADGGEPGAIDFRSLPMSADDRTRLLEALGPGEVLITLQADGESTIRETSVQGVWWNEHHDRGGELIASFIEVARVPTILPVESDELRRGAQRLRDGIAVAAPWRGN
jgi:hydrogenase-1 operon protein HyaF